MQLKIDDEFNVYIKMTLTTPNCPVAEDMPGTVLAEVKNVEYDEITTPNELKLRNYHLE